ncbi:GNAT family N-acetyltransferase [Streptomyces albidoflavus]|uniref:GNAT family N-acetyltransferase n=1 Tax=Streptomyces albidoflavus TaxID=1886 RepID=UPI00226DFA7A|nr:GNAT family N-acetyltransferase [Streptomyces albidoflavus]
MRGGWADAGRVVGHGAGRVAGAGRRAALLARCHHVQTRPELRGRGIGGALMGYVRQVAREELGLEQLHLAARGGAGLEEFYGRLGWRESGRRPGVLRFGPGDDRDEVLMHLAPL